MPSPIDHASDRPLLNQTQAAKLLAVSTRTMEGWRCRGGGPRFVRVGRRVRYRLVDLQEWIERRTFRSTSEADYPPRR